MYVKDRRVDAAAPPPPRPHTHTHTTVSAHYWTRRLAAGGGERGWLEMMCSLVFMSANLIFFFSLRTEWKTALFLLFVFLFLPICTRGACIAVLTLWGVCVGVGGGSLWWEVGWAGSFTFSPCPSDHFLLFFLSVHKYKQKKNTNKKRTYV